jgi:prolyl oligopeptidase
MRTRWILVCGAVACAHGVHTTPPPASLPATQPASAPATQPVAAADDDPYQWLEDVDGQRAMDWVKKQDDLTLGTVGKDPALAELTKSVQDVMDSKDQIPYVEERGPYLYNFWTDAEHPRGLWRRTTLVEYRKAQPAWEVLLDVDALGKAEKESWVWDGDVCEPPAWRHCLLLLSRGGADATSCASSTSRRRNSSTEGSTCPRPRAASPGATTTRSTSRPTSVPAR